MRDVRTNWIVKVAVLSAAAFVLQMLVPFKVGGFLDVEMSDYAAILGSFALGPVAGVAIELFKNILHMPMTTTGFIGELANFLINGVFVLVAGWVYKTYKCRRNAIIGLISGTLMMTVAGGLFNYYILLPMYMPTAPLMAKLNLILYTITPFNLAKGGAISLVAILTYKYISPLLHKK